MTIGKADGAETETLASRIVDCIREADACGLHVVAAHLDVALNALRGDGVRASDGELSPHRPLH